MSRAGRSRLRIGPDADPDRYVLGAAVASGAEGILYRGSIITATGLELAVAIKMLQPRFLPHLDQWQLRWSEQVELLRSLQVPQVVRVRDGFVGPLPHPSGEVPAERTLYLVMNWVDGEPLDEWVRRRPDRDPIGSLKVLLGVAVALDFMHSGRATGGIPVVHRDVKPSNILITEEGAVLVDFGLTRGLPGGHRLSGVTGTPGYVPPEVVETGTYTPAADRYAMGGVASFILTGKEPPARHDPAAVRAALAEVPAVATSPGTIELVMAMLDTDPAARPPSLANWIGQLRASSLPGLPELLPPEASPPDPKRAPLPTGPPPGPPLARGRSRRPPRLVLLALCAAAAVAGVAAVSALRGTSEESTRPGPGAPEPCAPPGAAPSPACPALTTTLPTYPVPIPPTIPAQARAPLAGGLQTQGSRPRTATTIDPDRPGAPPRVPNGIELEVQLRADAVVQDQRVPAIVRLRNGTSKNFYIYLGCDMLLVEVIDGGGNLIGSNEPAPACGEPTQILYETHVPPGQVVEREAIVVTQRVSSGPYQIRAAWGRVTATGFLDYVVSPPAAVQVVSVNPRGGSAA